MATFFQMLFCILAAICVAAAIPLAIFIGIEFCLIAVGGAIDFALLMLFVKNGGFAIFKKQKKTDYMNTDEENAAILREQKKQN